MLFVAEYELSWDALEAVIAKRLECPPLLVGGVEDHVQLLGRLGRSNSEAEWVKDVWDQGATPLGLKTFTTTTPGSSSPVRLGPTLGWRTQSRWDWGARPKGDFPSVQDV